MVPPFANEPLTDFSRPEARRAMEQALREVERRLGEPLPLVVGGERVHTAREVVSRDPCDKGRVVARAAAAGRAEAESALRAAWEAHAGWGRTDPPARARVLWRAAAIMRRRRFELMAWEVFEVAKTWTEADADVAEAIDFLEYYGRQMASLAAGAPLTPVPGEDNEMSYIPLGAGVVLPPWNFPLAIATGMTAAAVVAGNAVVLKPSSVSPAVAARLLEVLEEAGLPPGVVNYLPGPGGEVGDQLVAHPQTRFVAFTGSREVGCRVYEAAGRVGPGQRWLKRVVAEMGGKDCILVDEDADLDAAAEGILASAFGFQGQKCSACSRVVAVGRAYREVLRRVAAGAEALQMGPARDPESQVAAVVNAAQFAKVMDYVEAGRGEGRLVCGGEPGDAAGWYVRPTVFADVAPEARISQEEIFGPVVAFTPARDFDEALQMANGTVYGLTGSVYARRRDHLEQARREFHVGNLYLNRRCTGALVGGQPFGGFDMSGTDSKAGGPDYLLHFTQAKVISERL